MCKIINGNLHICSTELRIPNHRDCIVYMYRIAQNFDGGKVLQNLTNKACQKVDKQIFDKLIVTFIGKVLTGKRLKAKTLTKHSPFVKFVRLFHRQSFALYVRYNYNQG